MVPESLVGNVEAYLKECFTSQSVPHVTELASRLGVSSWSLTRGFQRRTGVTLGVYFKRSQVTRAILLLRTTRWPVEAIASRCGFSCARSFHRCFRRITGITPAGVRLQGSREPDLQPLGANDLGEMTPVASPRGYKLLSG